MPIHNRRTVEAAIFHDFHHAWIEEIKRALNRGILPPDHYALAEQIAGGFGPDVVTLEGPTDPSFSAFDEPRGGIALAEREPKVSFRAEAEVDIYAAKANRIAIHHVTDHRVVAMIEIVSPGNKSTLGAFRTFVEKASELIRSGIHRLIIDLFPPTPRDPQGNLGRTRCQQFHSAGRSSIDAGLLCRWSRAQRLHRTGGGGSVPPRNAAVSNAEYLRANTAGIHLRIGMGSRARDLAEEVEFRPKRRGREINFSPQTTPGVCTAPAEIGPVAGRGLP